MILFQPGSLYKIAIYPYLNNTLFYDNSLSHMPFLNYTYTSVKVPAFDYLSGVYLDDMRTNALDPLNYAFGACNQYKIDAVNYYNPIDTFTYSSFMAGPMNNVLKLSGSFTAPVVLPFNTTTSFSQFQEALWRIAVYPFVPFFVYTDAYPVNYGGPLFCKSFNISCNADQGTSVTVNFTGGTSVLPPEPGTIEEYYFPFTEQYDPSAGIGSTEASANPTFVYRQARTYDALFGYPYDAETINELGVYDAYMPNTSWYSNQHDLNITGMSLQISQELSEFYTGNNGYTKNISDGMRHLALKSRKVTGKISFVCSKDILYVFINPKWRTQEIVMYFGGPYYFPMKNVYFNFYDSTLNGDGYYEHTIEFSALYHPPTDTMDWYKLNMFDINYEGMFRPITGALYVEHQ